MLDFLGVFGEAYKDEVKGTKFLEENTFDANFDLEALPEFKDFKALWDIELAPEVLEVLEGMVKNKIINFFNQRKREQEEMKRHEAFVKGREEVEKKAKETIEKEQNKNFNPKKVKH